MIYVCAHCGDFNALPEPLLLDNGTTLTCSECGKVTFIRLGKIEVGVWPPVG